MKKIGMIVNPYAAAKNYTGEMIMKRIHAFVSGSVQGVFFRSFARNEAAKLGLTGFARNLDDGRVEIVAEGDEDKLTGLIEILKTKHPIAQVENIDAEWNEAKKEFNNFRIIH